MGKLKESIVSVKYKWFFIVEATNEQAGPFFDGQ